MITTIFFDFDGVLTTDYIGTGTVCGHLSEAAPGLSHQTITECYKKYCGHLLLGGKFAEVWDDFCASIGRKISPNVLRHALRTVPRNEEMFGIVQSLSKNFTLGIITDNPRERMELLNEDMSLPDLFNPIIISASVHALKHDGTTKIFDAALAEAACQLSESIFIDNQQRNLVTPSQMGMKTYWHDDKKNDLMALRLALHDLGVEAL